MTSKNVSVPQSMSENCSLHSRSTGFHRRDRRGMGGGFAKHTLHSEPPSCHSYAHLVAQRLQMGSVDR